MNKKMVAYFILPIFLLFCLSCTSIQKERINNADKWEGKKFQIQGILKTSGEKIEFPEAVDARVKDGHIVFHAAKRENFSIDQAQIVDTEKKRGEIRYITTRDGYTYNVTSYKYVGNKMIINGYESSPPLPISEVELLWVKKTDAAETFFAVIGTIAGIMLVAAIIIAATKESCPFIYSFNGEEYVFDAEPYGGAICQGLKRIEWCGLENLEEVNGQYRIRITNEIQETQYTDELKIVVVDHEKDVRVAPDVLGRIHTISEPSLPILTHDGSGKDLMPYIEKNDWIYWQTRVETKNPERSEDLREELTFVFPKPAGAKKAKLLFNGCNTLWGSQMLKRFLDLHGNKVYELYDEVNSFGPAFFKIMSWDLNEELYRLRLRVETDEGWKSKGMIFGGGPFISEDKVYPFDINDVSGNLLKIKLTPPSGFWMINHVAMDYTEDMPIEIQEIHALKAIDHQGKDIREQLAHNDNTNYVMPHMGDRADLVFAAPPRMNHMERSYLLKASGYYDIHLEAKGEPQTKIIDKCLDEPGYAIRLSLKEYCKWENEIKQKK